MIDFRDLPIIDLSPRSNLFLDWAVLCLECVPSLLMKHFSIKSRAL